MNELIQQLSDQATIRVNNPTVNSNGKVICDNWEEGVSLSKFAELIVKECVDIVEKDLVVNLTKAKTDNEGKIWTNAQLTFSQMIKWRFGVEE